MEWALTLGLLAQWLAKTRKAVSNKLRPAIGRMQLPQGAPPRGSGTARGHLIDCGKWSSHDSARPRRAPGCDVLKNCPNLLSPTTPSSHIALHHRSRRINEVQVACGSSRDSERSLEAIFPPLSTAKLHLSRWRWYVPCAWPSVATRRGKRDTSEQADLSIVQTQNAAELCALLIDELYGELPSVG